MRGTGSSGFARASLIAAGAVVAVAVVVFWLLARQHRPEPVEPRPRAVIVGIDGLDWDMAQTARAAGTMPHLDRMMREGASGVLRSIPPFISPSIWTTIATGKREEKHGVRGFLVDRGRTIDSTPTSSNMRRVKALWQIATDQGLSVGFIGWLVTWPAERVNGYMVSSNLVQLLESSEAPGGTAAAERLSSATYPPELAGALRDLRVRPEDVPRERVSWLLGTPDPGPDASVADGLLQLARIRASDATTLRFASHLMRSVPTDLSAAYFRGVDLTGHLFWRYHEPDEWPGELSRGAVDALGTVVNRYYAVADSLIGAMVELAGDDAVVIVCSDHGFGGHGTRPELPGDPPVGMEMHRPEGVIAMAGPGIRKGVTLEGAGVLDVAPTVLALLGLPVGRDMDGRVLTEAISARALKERPVAFVETHEGVGSRGDSEPVASPVDDEIKEMLRSLGYIQ